PESGTGLSGLVCGGCATGTVRGHGWPRRAYTDVLAACPGRATSTHQARTKPLIRKSPKRGQQSPNRKRQHPTDMRQRPPGLPPPLVERLLRRALVALAGHALVDHPLPDQRRHYITTRQPGITPAHAQELRCRIATELLSLLRQQTPQASDIVLRPTRQETAETTVLATQVQDRKSDVKG